MFENLIGIPFRYGGADIDGADCWGLARLVFSRFGYQIKDYCPSRAAITDSRLITEFKKHTPKWAKIDQPQIPCLALFATLPGYPQYASHCGVVIAPGRFLHVMEKTRSVIERLDHPWFKRKLIGFYVPGPAHNHCQPV